METAHGIQWSAAGRKGPIHARFLQRCPLDSLSGRCPMQSIQNYYIAQGAVVTGDVVLAPGVNIWFASVVRGDLARITLGPRVNIQDGCVVHTDDDARPDIDEG